MRQMFFLLGTVCFAMLCLPTPQAEARLRCRYICTKAPQCTKTRRCFVRKDCGPVFTRCFWVDPCRDDPFAAGGCRRRRVCKRYRRCTRRRVCRLFRTCPETTTRCRRVCYRTYRRATPSYRTYRRATPSYRIYRRATPSYRTYRRSTPSYPQRSGSFEPGPSLYVNHQKGHRTYPSNDDPFATLDPNASLEEKHSVRVLRKLRERARRRQQALQKIRERQERLHRARIAIKRPNNQRERIEAARRKTELATLERKRNAMMAELRSLENKRNAEQAKLQRIRQDAKLAKKSADTYKALAERMKAEAKRQRTLAAELKKQHDARMRLLRHMTSKERRRIGEERRLLAQMRKQQKRELHALQKQREAETKRLGELRRLAKRQNKLIARQKKLIARQRRLRSQLEHNRAANNTTLRRSYEKQLAMLRTETTQLKSQLSTISQRSQSLQNQEKQTQTAQSHFNRGEIEQARKLFSSSNQNEQLRLLDDFFKDYREGKSAYQRKTPERAIPALKSALRHDLELGGGKSVYTKRIRRMLATLYTAQGSREMSRSSYPLAYLYFSNARHYSPKHPTIRDALSRLRKLAQQQYLLAQQQSKRPAIARSKLLKVMRMVDATDPLYKKAERMLERIN